MARKKKSRKLTDIMPARKADKRPEAPKTRAGRKLSRYELDAQAREEKRKRKHKGNPSGARHSAGDTQSAEQTREKKDPRIGSRKKVPLMVEFVNRPDEPLSQRRQAPVDPRLAAEKELAALENNEILNDFLDKLDEGKVLAKDEQQFVDECLARIAELMDELGLSDEEEESEEDLYRSFETIDINRFR